MNCNICGKPIVLVPSAAERARKYQSYDGHPASYYTSLFTSHSECFVAKRSAESVELMRKIVAEQKRTGPVTLTKVTL